METITVKSAAFVARGYSKTAKIVLEPEQGRYVVLLQVTDGIEEEMAWEPTEPDRQEQGLRWAAENPEAAVLDAINIVEGRRA